MTTHPGKDEGTEPPFDADGDELEQALWTSEWRFITDLNIDPCNVAFHPEFTLLYPCVLLYWAQ